VYYNNTNLNIDHLNNLPKNDIPKAISENFTYIDVQPTVNIGHDNINREEDVDDDNNNDFSMSHSGLANQCESLSLDLIEEINLLKKSHIKKTKINKHDANCDPSIFITIPHGESPISEINNPGHLINAYPTLFPYGIGGIQDPRRKIALSYREHVKYLLSLNSDRFRTHRSFIFVAFNIMQRAEARQRINLLVNQKDYQQFSNEISSLTLQDFDDAVKTVSTDPNAKYNSIIHKLIAKVQSASANVQGTRAALKHRRNDIRAYMIYFGMPAFFITINPPDIHSPYLLKIGNVNITPDILGKNYQFRANFLKNNPVLQAISTTCWICL